MTATYMISHNFISLLWSYFTCLSAIVLRVSPPSNISNLNGYQRIGKYTLGKTGLDTSAPVHHVATPLVIFHMNQRIKMCILYIDDTKKIQIKLKVGIDVKNFFLKNSYNFSTLRPFYS